MEVPELGFSCKIRRAVPAATSRRLLDNVEKGPISFKDLQFLVLDEATWMLDMGFGQEIGKCMPQNI